VKTIGLLLVPALALGNSAVAQQSQPTATPSTASPAAVSAATPATEGLAAVPAATPASEVPAVVPTTASAVPVIAKPDASGRYMLREGEDVNLVFSEDLSSKTSSEGDPVTLTLADDLKIGDVVVAKAGSKAFGEVTKAEKSGMMGKAGQLNLRLDYLKVGEGKIKLRGTKGKEGASGTTSAVVLTVLFGPIGLIKHGHNVEIKKGQSLHAYVADDILVMPAS